MNLGDGVCLINGVMYVWCWGLFVVVCLGFVIC